MQRRHGNPGRGLRRLLSLALLPLLLALVPGRAVSLETVTLQLKWKHQFQFAGYYAAIAQGFYREAGLEVKVREAVPGLDPVDAVLSGAAEYGVGTSELLVRRVRGEKVVVLAVVFQHSPQALLARRGPDLSTVHDLAGKRVMLEPGAADLLAYLESEGLPRGSYTALPHSFDVRALLAGKVDALSVYTTDEAFLVEKAGLDHLVFTPRTGGIDFYGDNLFTTEARLAEHPRQVKAFRAASLRGWVWAMQHPAETVELVTRQYSQRHGPDHLLYEAERMRPLVRADLVEIGYMNPGRWRHIADTYAGLGILPPGASLDGFLYDPDPVTDLRWLHRALAATVAGAAVAAGVVLVVARLNRRLRREVRERTIAETKFRGIVEQTLAGIYIIQDDRFVYVNARFAEILGYRPDEVVGRLAPADVAAVQDRERVRESLRQRLEGEVDSAEYGFSALRKDGGVIDLEVNGRRIDFEGRPAVVGLALDVTERNRIQKQLNYLAFYDPLTELPNRALFFDRLGHELARSRRAGESFALFVLDLDGFKAVNDTHGHETGDLLLHAVARRLCHCVRESDTVARTGGDEFVLLLHAVGQAADAELVAGKVLGTLTPPFRLGGHECRVGASIGICIAPEDGEDMETLLSRADAAMYASKAAGKNRFTRFGPGLAAGAPVKLLLLEWTEELSVGVPVIDEQHARLAAVLSRLAEAVKGGQSGERIRGLLDELVVLARHHFETEERLMARYGYAAADAHGQEHRRLTEDLLSLQRGFDSTSLMLTLQALKDWLASHITHGDRELGEALVAAGAVRSTGARGVERDRESGSAQVPRGPGPQPA